MSTIPILIVIGTALLIVGTLEYGAIKVYGRYTKKLPVSLKGCKLNPMSHTMIICTNSLGFYSKKVVGFPGIFGSGWYYSDGESKQRIIVKNSKAHHELVAMYETLEN